MLLGGPDETDDAGTEAVAPDAAVSATASVAMDERAVDPTSVFAGSAITFETAQSPHHGGLARLAGLGGVDPVGSQPRDQ